MSCCSSCGSWIPDGQRSSCSMCYGDIDYGRDNYYRDWIEQQSEEQNQEQEDEQENNSKK
jgi:hypothetical protein